MKTFRNTLIGLTVFFGLVWCVQSYNKFCATIDAAHQRMSTWSTQSLLRAAQYGVDNDEDGKFVAFDMLSHRELDGIHDIRRMLPSDVQHESHLQGGFFLFSGYISGESTTRRTITFAWKSNLDGAYNITTLPLDNFRVKLSDHATPTVEFSWHWGWPMWKQADVCTTGACYSALIQQVTVTCDPSDWPSSVTLPMVQK